MGNPNVDPIGLLCFEVFEDEQTAFNEEHDGEDAGGLVTPPSQPPDSSEDEWSVIYFVLEYDPHLKIELTIIQYTKNFKIASVTH